MIIKSIIKELYKKKLSSVLIILQIIITTLVFSQCFCIIQQKDISRKQAQQLFDDNYKNIYQINILNPSDSGQFGKDFSKFNEKITKAFGIESIGGYHINNTMYDEISENEDFQKIRRQSTKGTFKEAYPSVIEPYTVDYSIYRLMKIKIVEGRNLNKDDFIYNEKKEIPMIISNAYSGVMELNGMYTDSFEKRKYKVVGFFDEQLFWLDKTDNPIKCNLVSLSDKVICPYFIFNENGLDSVIKSQCYYFNNNKNLSDSAVKNSIKQIARQCNMNVDVESISDQLLEIDNKYKEVYFSMLFLGIFLLVASCLGLSIVMYYSINLRKKELGVRMVCGGNLSYIRKLVFGEISFMVICAYIVIVLILFINRNNQGDLYNMFDFHTLSFVAVFLFLFSIITSIIPMIRISKLSPKDLLGGRE